MNCKNCNNPISEGSKFCGKCGVAVQSEVTNKKGKFWPVTAESVFGIRWIKTPRAKIITGIVMLGLVLFIIVDPTFNLKDMEVLTLILLVGGIWYIYKGLKSRIIGAQTSAKSNMRSVWIWMTIVIVVVGILAWMALNTRMNTWITYDAPNNNFSVTLPENPIFETKSQDTPNGSVQIDSYKSANRTADVAYIVNVSSFSSSVDVSDSSAFLENTVQLSANNGTVINSAQTTKDGYPAVDYLIEFVHPNTISRIRGLNILVNHKLYQLLTAYDKQQEYLLQYDKFINSFEVK